ncbi:MAG: restriction endonuclease [Ardenticatenaceae bacterium]|nr:restriction endonuclease [Ardenticatenaceae bacterium]
MKTIPQLMNEAREFIQQAIKIQDETIDLTIRKELLEDLYIKYHDWYRACLSLFDLFQEPEKKQEFKKQYEGGLLVSKISAFLTEGLKDNIFMNPDRPHELMRWQHPAIERFQKPLEIQCNTLAELFKHQVAPKNLNVEDEFQWHQVFRRIVGEFIRRSDYFDVSRSQLKKGLTYEHLAIILLLAIDGLHIIGHDIRSVAEESDLIIGNESTDAFWSRLGNPIIVECKYWDTPAGSQEIALLDKKMEVRRSSTGILFSKEGITGDRYRDAKAAIRETLGRNGRHIVVLDKNDLIDIVNGIHPSEKLREKYYLNFTI